MSFHLRAVKKKKVKQTEGYHRWAKGSPVLFSVFCFWGFGLVLVLVLLQERKAFPSVWGLLTSTMLEKRWPWQNPIFLKSQLFLPTTKGNLGNSHHPGIFQKIQFASLNHIQCLNRERKRWKVFPFSSEWTHCLHRSRNGDQTHLWAFSGLYWSFVLYFISWNLK